MFSSLQNKDAVTELFREIAPKVADRPGGYTRIIRTGYRLGDNAEMCMIELVDFNEIYTNEKAKSTTRRSRRGGGAKAAAASEETVVEATEVETTDAVEETTEEVKEETTEEPEAKADDSEEAETEEK